VSRFRHPAMKQLAEQQGRFTFADQQMRLAQRDRLLMQLARAETLLQQIDPNKSYPYQFVVFRVCDARTEVYPDLVMKGEDLAFDLREWIEEVSEYASLSADDAGEPVYTVEQLSKRYSISTKTVNRWRERGLVSRRFKFGGRTRVGFLKSSVDRFVAKHGDDVERGSKFSQMTDHERDEIIAWAKNLAQSPAATLAEVSRRIACKVGRSPETVRYTIRNFDRLHPEQAVFPDFRGPLDEQQKAAIYKLNRRGVSIDALAKRYQRTRSSIHRIINEVRARKLLETPIEFMNHPSFERPDAEQVIALAPIPSPERRSAPPKPPSGLPPYLQSLYEVPLLTRDEEQYLFRKMNYLFFKADHLLKSMAANPHAIRASDLDAVDKLVADGQEIKRRIIRANLRLVVSIAKRHVGPGMNLFELISDGNISLMRAVEKFDFGRGFKFSTYASWAIMKNFARSIPAENTRRDRFITGQELAFEFRADARTVESEIEQSHSRIASAVERILEKLDEREREIIIDRYGLSDRAEAQTLEQVGQKFGVTKERIRQIEARAMRKLKEYAKQEKIDISALG
jgi:RNA polymerase primary sigma factor